MMTDRTGNRPSSRVILVPLMDSYVGIEEGLESLQLLSAVPATTLVVWSTEATLPADLRERFAQAIGGCCFVGALPSRAEALMQYQGVYVPIVTTGTAYALSEGDDREPVIRTLLIAALLGLPIAVLGCGWDPESDAWTRAGLGRASSIWPDAWRARSQYVRRLGVSVLRRPGQVSNWAKTDLDGPRVLDVEMVESRRQLGMQDVPVGPRTVVTPGAHDRMRQYGMTLRLSGEKS